MALPDKLRRGELFKAFSGKNYFMTNPCKELTITELQEDGIQKEVLSSLGTLAEYSEGWLAGVRDALVNAKIWGDGDNSFWTGYKLGFDSVVIHRNNVVNKAVSNTSQEETKQKKKLII